MKKYRPSHAECAIKTFLDYPCVSSFERIGAENQTYELAMIAVKENGMAIRRVAARLVDKKLCKEAIKKSWWSFKYINKKFINYEFCLDAVRINGRTLEHVPEQYRDKQIIRTAIKNCPYMIKLLPKSQITNKLTQTLLELEKSDVYEITDGITFVKHIPKSYFTEDFIIQLLNKSVFYISAIPKKMITKNIVSKVLRLFEAQIDKIYKQFRTNIFGNPIEEYLIKYIPKQLHTYNNCKKFALLQPGSLHYIPKKYLTKEIVLLCIKKEPDLYYEVDLPKTIKNDSKIVNELLKNNPSLIMLVDEKFHTKERLIKAFEKNEAILLSYEDNQITKIRDYLNKSDIKIKYYNDSDYIEFIRIINNQEQFLTEDGWLAINDNEQTKILPEPYNLPDTNEIILTKTSKRKEIAKANHSVNLSKYDTPEIEIFYISDIHIEFLFKNKEHIKAENIENIIIDKTEKFLKSIPSSTKKRIIVVAGDLANDILLAKVFFKAIKDYHGSNIDWLLSKRCIYILGNHEYWNTSIKSNRKYMEIVDLYKQNIDALILENELLLFDSSRNSTIIDTEDINVSNEIDLKTIINESDVIIYGGTGFSGLNETFNANNNIYNNVINRNEDIKLSSLYENNHNLITRLTNKQIIFISHNPLNDWHKGRPSADCIYINGHTHRNTGKFYKNKSCVFADNQVGYKNDSWLLKSFTLNYSVDPIGKYTDGIHQITQKIYNDYLRHISAFSICSHEGKYYLIKRNNIKMFLLETNSGLNVLDYGRRRKLPNKDIEYYFNNIENYFSNLIQLVHKIIYIRNIVQLELQKISLDCNPHGTIIDLNSLLHIAIDFNQLKLIPYYSAQKYHAVLFVTISDLLSSKKHGDKNLLKLFNKQCKNSPLRKNESYLSEIEIKNYDSKQIYNDSSMFNSLEKTLNHNLITIWREKTNMLLPNITYPKK